MSRVGPSGEYEPTPAEIERWKIKLKRERQAKEFKQTIEQPDILPEDDEDDEVPTLRP